MRNDTPMEEKAIERRQYDYENTVKVPYNILSYIWPMGFILTGCVFWVGKDVPFLTVITNVVGNVLAIISLLGFNVYLMYPLLRYMKRRVLYLLETMRRLRETAIH